MNDNTTNLRVFDSLEERIIKIVERDNGVTIPEIAKEISRPLQTIRYRVMLLEAEGAIKGRWHRRGKFYYANTSSVKR